MRQLALTVVVVSMTWLPALSDGDDPATHEIVIDLPTVMNAPDVRVCNKLTVKADLKLNGAGAVISNGFANAAMTIGGADVDRPVTIEITNDAQVVSRRNVPVSVLNRGGIIRVSNAKQLSPGWGNQATDAFFGTGAWNGFVSTFGFDYKYTVDAGVVAGKDGLLDLAWIGPKGLFGCGTVDNRSTSVPVRLLFAGGALYQGYTDGTLFQGAKGAKIILEGVDGHAIFLRNCYTFSSLADGNVKLVTTGACDVVWGTGNSTRPTLYLTGDIDWCHRGDFILCGLNDFRVTKDNVLPYGPGKGNVCLSIDTNGYCKMSWNDPRSMCRLDLNGKTVNVNSFYGLGNLSSFDPTYVTNLLTSVRGTLVVGAEVESSELTGVFGGLVDVRKRGTGTVTVGRKKTRFENGAVFCLDAGTAVFKSQVEKVEKLVLAAGTTLVVDGVTLEAGAIVNDGATVECRNGGSLVLIKRGADELLVQNLQKLAGDIHVAEGALTLNGDTCTNEYWRLTIDRAGKGRQIMAEMGRFVLLDTADVTLQYGKYPTANALTTGLSLAGDEKVQVAYEKTSDIVYYTYYVYDSVTPAKDLQPGTVTMNAGHSWKEGLNGRKFKDAATLFKSIDFNDVFTPYGGSYALTSKVNIEPTVPESHPQIVWRVAAGQNRAKAYSMLQCGWNTLNLMPDSWTLETSPDGETWVTVDSRVGIDPARDYDDSGKDLRNGSWYCGGVPFVFNGTLHLNGAAGLDATANLQVDAGATFDGRFVEGGSTEVSALTVDLAKGAGMLKGVRMATKGAVYFKSESGKVPSGDIGLTFDAEAATGDLSGWKVFVNGIEKPGRTLYWENGKLVLGAAGLTILVR